ncbi:MAG TPA: hypothetical protein DEF45_19445 [Rhodopirellula sp.]|nr:hypothetical protein [Rhodopirellula sp.]
MAKSDLDGRFRIKNLPVRKHIFRVWHERLGFLRSVPLGQHSTDPTGRVEITIERGMNQWKTAHLGPDLFLHHTDNA